MATEQQDGRTTHGHGSRRGVVNRLSRIEGHVRGLKRMVEEDAPCPDLLVQIAAVRSALNAVGRVVLQEHIRSCMVEAAEDGEFEDAYRSLEDSLDRFIH